MNASSSIEFGGNSGSLHPSESSSSISSTSSFDRREIISQSNQSEPTKNKSAVESSAGEVGMFQLASLTAAASAVESKSAESKTNLRINNLFT